MSSLRIVEIASYPKSGNTWFRHLVSSYLKSAYGLDYLPLDIGEKSFSLCRSDSELSLPGVDGDVFIYKSHVFNNPAESPGKIIHIYRHPLDVFLSALNHLHNQSENFPAVRKEALFLSGKPKTVEAIFESGEMDFYFDRFLENVGANFWPGMLKKSSNYFEYVLNGLSSEGALSIRYEDLLDNTSDTVNRAMNYALDINENVCLDLEGVNKKTKDGGNRRFYWKAKSKNYESFLTKKQISDFEALYTAELKDIGYL